ncbi:MAG: hypothetical protein K0R12_1266 [Gammaproteobacteria bacterium]|jgi:hypothetical protein|nr:hypothetical protein [Gammaproteobacteria bacterium]
MNVKILLEYDKIIYKKIIKNLIFLKQKIYRIDCYQERAAFAGLILNYYLLEELKRENALLKKHNLSERDFDTCLEMGDAEQVIGEIIAKAQLNANLAKSIKDQLGECLYINWEKVYKAQLGYQYTLF